MTYRFSKPEHTVGAAMAAARADQSWLHMFTRRQIEGAIVEARDRIRRYPLTAAEEVAWGARDFDALTELFLHRQEGFWGWCARRALPGLLDEIERRDAAKKVRRQLRRKFK